MFTVKYWTTCCIVLRENNTNSSVTRKRHMDMVRKQQLLIDSLLGKSAEDTQSFEKKSLNFSQIIVHFLSLQDVNGLRLFLVLGGGGSGVISYEGLGIIEIFFGSGSGLISCWDFSLPKKIRFRHY